jgi:hypothetical protein
LNHGDKRCFRSMIVWYRVIDVKKTRGQALHTIIIREGATS